MPSGYARSGLRLLLLAFGIAFVLFALNQLLSAALLIGAIVDKNLYRR